MLVHAVRGALGVVRKIVMRRVPLTSYFVVDHAMAHSPSRLHPAPLLSLAVLYSKRGESHHVDQYMLAAWASHDAVRLRPGDTNHTLGYAAKLPGGDCAPRHLSAAHTECARAGAVARVAPRAPIGRQRVDQHAPHGAASHERACTRCGLGAHPLHGALRLIRTSAQL